MHISQLKGFFTGVGATAAIAFGLMGLSGFQANSMKVATVDFMKVYNDSPLAKSQDEVLRRQDDARRAVLEFVNTYPTITKDQATKFRQLSLKKDITEAEGNQLSKLKQDVIAEEKKSRDLQTKANPTQDDLKAIEAYRTRGQATREMLQNWLQEFRGEMTELTNQARQDLAGKVRSFIAEVGKREGYTVVYDITVAPYAANDITAAAVAAASKGR